MKWATIKVSYVSIKNIFKKRLNILDEKISIFSNTANVKRKTIDSSGIWFRTFGNTGQRLYQLSYRVPAWNGVFIRLMPMTIKYMSIHVQHIDENISQCKIFLSQVCPLILLSDFIDKIRVLNCKLHSFLKDVKASKLAKLFSPRSVSSNSTGSANERNLVFTIPPDLPLSDPEICSCERSQVCSQLRASWFVLRQGKYRSFFPPFTS